MIAPTEDFWVVVRSRNRTEKMAHIQTLLPTALICVGEDEKEAYLKEVNEDKLWLHPTFDNNSVKREWIYNNCPAETVVLIDDDLRDIKCVVGRYVRVIKDPGAILQIILNGRNLARDLGVSLFSWGRMPNPMHFRPHAPFSLTGPCFGAVGMVGRKIKVDTRFRDRGDIDLTMRAIMEDRFVIHDRRFYWDFGPTGYGRGGLRMVTGHDDHDEATEMLKARWGKYLVIDRKLQSGGVNISIRVPRRAAIATWK